MDAEQAKRVLRHPNRVLVLTALSYVNLSDLEYDVILFRYLHGHTQAQAAERFHYSVNGLQKLESRSLKRCAAVWDSLVFVRGMLDSALE